MSRAADLFARIERDGAKAVDELFADRAFEELFLEFKTSRDDGTGGKLHDHDRQHLKKAIGGFANSEGGVVVWGVEDDPASPSRGKLLVDARRFAGWLELGTSSCTVPPVIGIRSIPLIVSGEAGYVATFVPRSPLAPHQLAGEGRYLIRSGSSFSPAPHGVVAGLFGRAPQPELFLNFVLGLSHIPAGESAPEYLEASLTFALVNSGQVVAEDPFLSTMIPNRPKRDQGIGVDPLVDWPRTSAVEADLSLMSPREFRLAPGGMISVLRLRHILSRTAVADFDCVIRAGCRGAVPVYEELFASKDELSSRASEALDRRSEWDALGAKFAAGLFGLKRVAGID